MRAGPQILFSVDLNILLPAECQNSKGTCRHLANTLNKKAVHRGVVWSGAVSAYGPGALDRTVGGRGSFSSIQNASPLAGRPVAFIQLRAQMGKLTRQSSF